MHKLSATMYVWSNTNTWFIISEVMRISFWHCAVVLGLRAGVLNLKPAESKLSGLDTLVLSSDMVKTWMPSLRTPAHHYLAVQFTVWWSNQGLVVAPRVTRHFWRTAGCIAAAEHLCSQRLTVGISSVQLLGSSQLTNSGSITEVELSGPLQQVLISQ